MKSKSTIILATALAVACTALLGGDPTIQTVQAVLHWTVTTNWTQSAWVTRTLMGWTGDKDPNFNIYHESGTIMSNLVADIEWKGVIHRTVLESIEIGTTNREYTIEEKRLYR